MPLEKQIVTIPFVKGQQQKLDSILVDGTALLSMTDCTFNKNGTIRRRDGALQIASSIGTVTGMGSIRNELLVYGPGTSSLYSSTAGVSAIPGVVSPCTVTKTSLQRAVGYAANADSASNGTIIVCAWQQYNQAKTAQALVCAIFDEATGEVLSDVQSISTTASVARVVWVSSQNAFFIAYAEGANGKVRAIPSSTRTVGAALTFDTTVGNGLDAVSFANVLQIVYSSSGTNSLLAVQISQTNGVCSLSGVVTTLVSGQVTLPNANIDQVSCAVFSPSVCAAFVLSISGAAAGVGGITFNQLEGVVTAFAIKDPTVPFGQFGNGLVCGPDGSGNVSVYWDAASVLVNNNADSALTLRTFACNSSLAITSGPSTFLQSNQQFMAGANVTSQANVAPMGPFLAGRPLLVGGNQYLPVSIGNSAPPNFFGTGGNMPSAQTAFFLLDSSARVVAKALYPNLGFTPQVGAPNHKASWTNPSGQKWSLVLPEVGLIAFAQASLITPVGLCRMTFDFSSVPQIRTQIGPNLLFGGGFLSQYDGHQVTEVGFHYAPTIVAATAVAGAGLGIGSYSYVALYEWTDGQGQRHQSAPSLPVTVTTTGGNQKVNVSVSTLQIGQRLTTAGAAQTAGVNIVVYRTQLNGTTYTRVNPVASPAPNVTNAAIVTYADTTADTAIASQEALYTTGGALGNDTPGAVGFIFQHQNRLWQVGLEDPYEVRFSQAQVSGGGLMLNETLSGRVPPDTGALVGGASIDNYAILFTERGIFIVSGDGPSSSGLGGNYSPPQRLPVEVGCSDPRSIARTEERVLFKSSKGWYQIDRALQAKYIGGPVASYDAISVASAVTLKDKQQTRFGLTTSSGGMACLVWDSLFDQWAAFSIPAQSDGVLWQGLYTVLTQSHTLVQDTPGAFADALGATIPVYRIQTGWFRLAGMEGFQRVRRMFLVGSATGNASTLSVTVNFDFDTSSPPGYTFTVAEAGLAGPSAWLLRHQMQVQKCSAVQFTILDTPSGIYDTIGLSAITLEVAVKRGGAKLPAARST